MSNFLQELRRRNVLQTASIYLVTAWLILQIVDTVSPYLHLPTAFGTAVTVGLVIGFPVTVVLSWIFEITPQGVKRSEEVAVEASITEHTGRRLNVVLVILLCAALSYIGYDTWTDGRRGGLTGARAGSGASAVSGRPVTHPLAVLPFANMSGDADQEYFVDGLTEEILNALARIKGLMVVGRTSSFAYKNRNMDLRRIAAELDVDLLLEGSVRKSDDGRIRVTTQLIDADSGTHLLSETFDRTLADVFTIQRDLADQVAAALKLSVLHEGDQYRKALSQLDYVEVERLVSARARLANWDEIEIREALGTLSALEAEHPDVPEVVGLLAYAHMMLFSTTDTGDDDFTASAISLAERALTLDPTNFDALTTLAALYDDFADLRREAYAINQKMLRYHPGKREAYTEMLGFLSDSRFPCTRLDEFASELPAGILDDDAAWALRRIVDACFQPPLRPVDDEQRQRALDDMTLFLDLPRDETYEAVKANAEETGSQRHLMLLYLTRLRMGATEAARATRQRLDTSAEGFMSWYTALFGYAYGERTERTPADLFEFTVSEIRNAPDPVFVVPLIMQAQAENRPALVSDYLAGVPPFPIDVMNRRESFGLLLLHYYGGNREAARLVAARLLEQLDDYYGAHPRAFRFWGLASYAVAAACHAGVAERASEYVDRGYSAEHAFWIDNLAAYRLALTPCAGEPATDALLAAFERDRVRARQRFAIE